MTSAAQDDAFAFEHKPFVGSQYKAGGVMIWGFSHHKDSTDQDGPDFSQRIIERWALTGKHWYFRRLASFFGAEQYADFWQGVAFANSLPTCVASTERYSAGTNAQRQAVAGRVKHILTDLAPSKAVLFSTKGWQLWPALNGSMPEPGHTMITAPDLKYGTYDFAFGREIRAYNLPHPQGQSTALMTERVAMIMAD